MNNSIKLKYTKPGDIFINKDENVTDTNLNRAFNKLLINDKTISPVNNIEPKIWECKWYNNNEIEGYKAGTAVWYNTEDIDQFINKRSTQIYDYCVANTKLANKIKKYDPTDEECYNLYKSVVSGYYDDDSGRTFQPLYDIGNLSDHVQIYILQKDGSKISPSEDLKLPEDQRHWKPFFKSSRDIAYQILSSYSKYIFDQHIQDYHLGKYALKPDKSFIYGYLKNDMSNVDESYQQKLQSHSVRQSTEGFDFVKKYVRDYVSTDVDFTEQEQLNIYYAQISSNIHYTLSMNGEFDKSAESLKSNLNGVINYSETEFFINRLEEDNQAFGNIYFKLSSNTPSTGQYPFIVNYSERNKITGIKSKYQVVYEVFDLTKDTPEILKNQPYTTTQQISGYYRGYNISNMIDVVPSNFKIYQDPVSSYVDTVTTGKITIEEPTKWFRLWNSGYLEHGGIINVPICDETIISVFLDWEYNGEQAPIYDYTTDNIESFYGLYTEYTDANGKKFNNDGCIDKNNRYTISISPVGDMDNIVGVTEITMIRNNGFCIKLDNKTTKNRIFRYYTSGFVETGGK